MTVLTTPCTGQRSGARSTTLPITVEPPRGGVFSGSRSRAVPRAVTRSARDVVLGAIWPLLRADGGPAPTLAASTLSDAAVATLRACVMRHVAAFRARLGIVAASFDGESRVNVEDLALTMRVDEGALLDRAIAILSPCELLAAAAVNGTGTLDATDRLVGLRVEVDMLGLVQASPLSETVKARTLAVLADWPA